MIFAIIVTTLIVRLAIILYCGLKTTSYVFSRTDWRANMHKVDAFKVAPKQLISLHKWTYKQFYPEFK